MSALWSDLALARAAAAKAAEDEPVKRQQSERRTSNARRILRPRLGSLAL
jgi:hypothetical protein